MQDALSKGPGDAITYAIVMQLAAGFRRTSSRKATARRSTYSDQLVINELMAWPASKPSHHRSAPCALGLAQHGEGPN
jgi:hypothetical protein